MQRVAKSTSCRVSKNQNCPSIRLYQGMGAVILREPCWSGIKSPLDPTDIGAGLNGAQRPVSRRELDLRRRLPAAIMCITRGTTQNGKEDTGNCGRRSPHARSFPLRRIGRHAKTMQERTTYRQLTLQISKLPPVAVPPA